LPQRLRELIEATFQRHQKIAQFDAVDRGEIEPPAPVKSNPVAAQLAQINAAFGH
jgi:hypothetical protein